MLEKWEGELPTTYSREGDVHIIWLSEELVNYFDRTLRKYVKTRISQLLFL